MTINKCLFLGLFYLLSISIIFAEKTRVLWDFGVIIKTSEQQIIPEKSIKSLSNVEIEAPHQVKALIADHFIPPTLFSLNNIVYNYFEDHFQDRFQENFQHNYLKSIKPNHLLKTENNYSSMGNFRKPT